MGKSREIVTIEQPFFLAKFPVTNQLYEMFMKATARKKPYYWDDKCFNEPNQPVVGVTWDDAEAYCDWLTREHGAGSKEHGVGKLKFRLPTEAEWEWVAGHGEREYPWGNQEPDDSRAKM